MQVSSAPYGTQAATMDVEGAYRTIPIKPDHKRFAIVRFGDEYYIDHNVPFGAASAHGLQGEVADATVDIYYSLGIQPVIKWVDDFDIFRYPSLVGSFSSPEFPLLRYDYDLHYIKNIIAPLNIPWHREKGQDFHSQFPYLGFWWDLTNKTVAVPEKKLQKYIYRLTEFISKCEEHSVLKKDVEKINGTLSHISFVHLRGRSRLSNLFLWHKTFSNPFAPRWPPPSVVTDLNWWLAILRNRSHVRSLVPSLPPIDIGIWVDASTGWGIGLLCDGLWDAWRLVDDWKGAGRDIGWLEAVAVEFIVSIVVVRDLHDISFLVRSDNQGVIGAFEKGRSRNPEVNLVIRRTETLLDRSNLVAVFEYVESSTNLADPVSRGIFPSHDSRLPYSFTIDSHIRRFFLHV
jgi:hypothetical protein